VEQAAISIRKRIWQGMAKSKRSQDDDVTGIQQLSGSMRATTGTSPATRAKRSAKTASDPTSQPQTVEIISPQATGKRSAARRKPAGTLPDDSHAEGKTSTRSRRSVTVSGEAVTAETRASFPRTIHLPAIPTEVAAATKRETAPQRALTPAASRDLDDEQRQATDTHAIVLIPGAEHPAMATTQVGAPALHPKARIRSHRIVIAGAGAILAVALFFTVIPLARGSTGGPLAYWLGGAHGYAFPTPTPTPRPVYAVHPVVSGEYDFVCTALPFARLAQQEMIQNGQHPWYLSVILAQWGIEQGWSMPGYTGYNFGNVSAISGYPYVGGVNVPGSPSAFAYAYTPVQGVFYYTTYTQMGLYAGVTNSWVNGPIAQAIALGESPWDAGHYTGDGNPGSSLVGVINVFGLERFDSPGAHC
jgi:hypothetical protein